MARGSWHARCSPGSGRRTRCAMPPSSRSATRAPSLSRSTAVRRSRSGRPARCESRASRATRWASSSGEPPRGPMDSGFRSPLVDCFRRGEVARDDRLTAAQGMLAPAHEQVALLLLLVDDPEADVAAAAAATIQALPLEPLRAFLARADVPAAMGEHFAGRGIHPADAPAAEADEPLFDPLPDEPVDEEPETPPAADQPADKEEDASPVLSSLPIMKRIKLAMKGSKTQRAQLVRDPNKMVSTAVLSSPKLTEAEVEAFAKAGNVSEDILRIIAM